MSSTTVKLLIPIEFVMQIAKVLQFLSKLFKFE